MDRTTAKKVFNEFTTDIDLSQPGGVLSAEKLNAAIMQALKPLVEEGKAFRRARVDRATGVRSVSYSYSGGTDVQKSIDAILGSIPESMGFDNPEKAPPFTISEQKKRYYTQTTERILDPRTAAAVRAKAVRMGGTAATEKDSGLTTTMVPTTMVKALHAAVEKSDQQYLAGDFSSALSAGSTPANIHERAFAAISRQNKVLAAKQVAMQAFVEANPESPLAKQLEAKMTAAALKKAELEQRLESRELSKVTPENAKEKATAALKKKEWLGVAKKAATEEFIAKNPNSMLAKSAAVKASAAAARAAAKQAQLKKAQQRKTAGAARLAGGALMGLIGTIVGLVGTGLGILTKILGGVMETAKSTTKMMVDGARFNLGIKEMNTFKGVARGMGYAEGEEPFSAIMGTLSEKFSNPLGGFAAGITEAAPFLKDRVTSLVDFATQNQKRPDKVMYAVLADAMNETMAGRSSTQTNLSPAAAMVANTPFVSKILGSQGGDMYARLFERMRSDNLLRGDKPYSPEEMEMIINGFNDGRTANTVAPSAVDFRAAKEGTKATNEFTQIWKGLTDTVWTKMLGYVGEILALLRTWLRPVIASMDPAWAAREDSKAVTENKRLTKVYEDAIGSDSGYIFDKYMKGRKKTGYKDAKGKFIDTSQDPIMFASHAKELYDRIGATGDVPGLQKMYLKEELGMDPVQLRAMVHGNTNYFAGAQRIMKLRADLGSGVGAGIFSLFGVKDQPGATPMPFGGEGYLDALTRDLELNAIKATAEYNSSLMGTRDSELPPDPMNMTTPRGRELMGIAMSKVNDRFDRQEVYRQGYNAVVAEAMNRYGADIDRKEFSSATEATYNVKNDGTVEFKVTLVDEKKGKMTVSADFTPEGLSKPMVSGNSGVANIWDLAYSGKK
jgi:hypothetical protein